MSRIPLRVSFFGGGTDYPEYFAREGRRGAVVGMAIDKYIYIASLRISGIQPYSYRVSYSQVERVQSAQQIKHAMVRAALEDFGVKQALDINIMSDMPASTGLGSSSAFTVGLVSLLSRMGCRVTTKLDLAKRAIHLERDVLGERVGVQDQLHAAFGGINRFDFDARGIRIQPVAMQGPCLEALCGSLLLVYTGATRHASATLEEQIRNTAERKIDTQLDHLLDLVDEAVRVLEGGDPGRVITEFGRMMHEGWQIKRSLSSRITTPEIDDLYDRALAAGALGGKLCGAGGGGFLLMVVPPDGRARVMQAVAPAKSIEIGLDTEGTFIVYS